MLGTIFNWIYCMDISVLLLILAATTIGFAWVYRRYHGSRWFKPVVGVLFVLFTAAILAVTLFRSGEQTALEPSLIPFESYRAVLNGGNVERLRSNFMNVVLFYPAGLFAAVLLSGKWHPILRVLLVTILLAGMSLGIEYAQYICVLGQPEVDDVIHNTLGALIGSVCGNMIGKSIPNTRTE